VRRFIRPLRGEFVVLLALVLIAVGALYLWPLDDDGLHPAPRSMTYAEASARITTLADAEKKESGIRPECRSHALLHGDVMAKAVLLLHGYTDCPAQFTDLAKLYYQRGYNVFVPLAPRHGTVDPLAHAHLAAQELVDYATTSMDMVAALGKEAGTVGVSGGGVLATYLATTRPGQVRRLLVISPFYRPAAGQAPAVIVKPITVLFGFGLIPDHVNDNNFSFAALSRYSRLAAITDTGTRLPALRGVAVVTSANDTFIDLPRARKVPGEIAETNDLPLAQFEIPAATGIGHDAVAPAGLGSEKASLYARYLGMYEGQATSR
jgi:carboxylesterase